ncbi:MAG: MFS transporter [Candidatus Omnitrophica bacterium]|nr:MFS transporter [Candidatus Omnitrophota bacterium]
MDFKFILRGLNSQVGRFSIPPKTPWAEARLGFIFRALKHKNYRLFFGGQSISLVGTWMQMVAMSWLVYRLTNSALLLGIVGFVGQIPSFFLMPFAGVIADRYNRHRILIATQTLAMLQAVALSVLVITEHVEVWHIVVLNLILGLVSSFDIPVRQAFTVEMIENKDDLGNAIALNSSMVNVARLLGPSIAGIIIAFVGEGACFFINAFSYLAVIFSLLAMKITPKVIKPPEHHVWHDLKEGFVYAFNFAPIRDIIFLLGLASLMGVPYQILMPVFAKDIFHGGPQTLGFLVSMAGIGALAGAIYLAGRKSVIGLVRMIGESSILFGLGVIAFSFSKTLWFSMIVICMAGFAMMVQMAASNTILQTIVEEDKRGRVMSFYTMAFMGMTPFGSLFAGYLANKIGAPYTLMVGGVCCIFAALGFLRNLPSLREKMRPVYIEKGIITPGN